MAYMLPYSFSVHVTALDWRTAFPARLLLRLYRLSLPRLILPTCVPTFLISCSTGISTCSPSATPLGLALGPDLPRADQLYSGNLGYSAGRIPTFLSLLIPAFSLPRTPHVLTVMLPRSGNAPLPHRLPCAYPKNFFLGKPVFPGNLFFPWNLFFPFSLGISSSAIRRIDDVLSFGGVFQPRTFSAQNLSTSELLRTLLMCGCF